MESSGSFTVRHGTAPGAGIDPRAYLDDRAAEGIFRVRREVFTDPAIFEAEIAHVFEGTWVYVGLENQIRQPHDYVTTWIGRQPVLLTRDADGRLGCFLNSCRHRGAILAPYKVGRARLHVCRYHGWTFDSGGRCMGVAQHADGQYAPAFEATDRGLTPVARLASYRGFVFASLNPDVPSLDDHLGEARKILDLIVDQSPQGVEYVPGAVTYTFDGNWKLQFENGLDYYHFNATHASYVDVLMHRIASGAVPPPTTYEAPEVEEGAGSWSFAHGHALMYAVRKQGRVHVRPLANDPGALDEIRARVGPQKAQWMLRQRNLTIFPNLQIVDISAQQLRTWRPLAPGRTEMTSHCLAPVGEGAAARAMRIRNYEDFFNSTGMGSSDDNLMYDFVQSGYQATAGGALLGYERGLGQPVKPQDPYAHELGLDAQSWKYGPITFGDETCFHAGYREWRRLLERGRARQGASR